MIRTKRYDIQGKPAAWMRTGIVFSTRKIYDSQKQMKLIIGLTIKAQHNDEPPFYGPVAVDIYAYFERPKTKKYHPVYYDRKPDFDNIAKIYCDILSDCAVWNDDCQVSDCRVRKLWGDEPGVTIIVKELK